MEIIEGFVNQAGQCIARTGLFFVKAIDAMGAITEWVKARNIKKGRQEMRQQVEKCIAEETARGTRFLTPPPFDKNGEPPRQ